MVLFRTAAWIMLSATASWAESHVAGGPTDVRGLPAIVPSISTRPSVFPAFETIEEQMAAKVRLSTATEVALQAIEGFFATVGSCWAVDRGDPSGEVVVSVSFSLTPEGWVEGNRVGLNRHEDGDEQAVQRAFETARRTVLRCQGEGYVLPVEAYDTWRNIVLTFDPSLVR